MSVLTFLSVLILVITLTTLIFGIIAYFLYKAREKNRPKLTSYEDVLKEMGSEYIFFE